MSRRDRAIALCLALAVAVAAISATNGVGVSAGSAHRRYASERYGFSVPVPAGWHRSRRRLVPGLLDPREILSLGTFGMRVGGGGNCGREPSAAIEAMKPGDALVTIQEVGVSGGLRRHLRRVFPPRPAHFHLGDPGGAPWLGTRRTSGSLRYAKLLFSENARAFEALVYVDGRHQPVANRDVERIVDGLRFTATPVLSTTAE